MEKNKKAMEMVNVIIVLILALLLLWVMTSYLGKGKNAADNTLNPVLAKANQDACRLTGTQAINSGKEFKDCDEDGYPDSCDNCIDGDNSIDGDLDGMSDECETSESADDPKKIVCEYVLKENRKICVTKEDVECNSGDDFNKEIIKLNYD